ncbi:sorbitol dehydrogenase-like [Sycon ciliatum]|uniref:sorbitol dehydrogenase-like n=1 Tax=Sycon ciliatum TaxID=27933 RepID=UPI0020A875E8|eukprot:scpid79580/ scgid15838/ Sorbitol dehydrogenase; L-iditol 2-dehydrogenase
MALQNRGLMVRRHPGDDGPLPQKTPLLLQMEDIPMPAAGPGEAVIKMERVGICGSDVHYWQHGYIGDFIVGESCLMGHESAGVVHEVGDGVTNVKVGDRVAIEPGVPCRRCFHCKTGHYNLCPDMAFCATPPIHGNCSTYYKHAADFLFKLPDHVTSEQAALLEPLSVGVHACGRAGVAMGSNVLIMGAGPIGLVCLLVAKASGAATVTIVDLIEQRLEMAKKLGADFCITSSTSETPEQLAARIEKTVGHQADQTTECTGAAPCVSTAIYGTRSGGTVVLVGLGRPKVEIPIVNASVREVDIRGIFRYCNAYPVALQLVASGKITAEQLDLFVTHRYKLADAATAFETTLNAVQTNSIKVMIEC